MSSPRFRRGAALLASSLLVAVIVAPSSAGAASPQPPSPEVSLPEGPWPPRSVLAADPLTVAQPEAEATAMAAVNCPAAPYGVKRYAPGTGKTVALTFDDGPGKTTMAILSILQRTGVPATFFNLGVNSAVRPTEVRSEVTAAQALGNHTWDHPRMPELTASAQARQMDTTSAEQVSLVGRPPCVFRPPYGEYNATTLTLAQQRAMTVWNWSVDTEDWKAGTSTSSYWVDRIVSRAQAGASLQHPVILMHNPPAGIPATVTALPRIISFYRSHGYTFVDLLGDTGQGRPGPAATVTSDALHVFARSDSGALLERTRSASVWTAWKSFGGVMVGGPAAIASTAATSTVFLIGTDNQVWQNTITDARLATGWARLGGIATSKPGAAIGADLVVTVVVRGTDTAAWIRQRVGSEWGSWLSLGGVLRTAPAVAATAGGLTVATVGEDKALWVRNRTATWSSWRRVGGVITADPALVATSSGVLAVLRGSDNAVWVNVGDATGTSWKGWQTIGGRVTSAATVTVQGSAAHVFGYGTDGRIWENVAADAATGSGWNGWRAMP